MRKHQVYLKLNPKVAKRPTQLKPRCFFNEQTTNDVNQYKKH